MTDEKRVIILGGHGKVARLATGKFKAAGYAVDSVIRNPDQRDDVRAVGGNPVVLDIESARVDDLAAAFDGASAVVFSAGAGGGNPERTRAVDHDAATRAMAAAAQAGVDRFVTVSYAGAAYDVDRIDPEQPFYVYARAKHDADAHLRETGLDYTILGPGRLTGEPATGKLHLTDGQRDSSEARRETSRENVAEVLVHVITNHAASRQTVNFYDGDTPIAEAIGPA